MWNLFNEFFKNKDDIKTSTCTCSFQEPDYSHILLDFRIAFESRLPREFSLWSESQRDSPNNHISLDTTPIYMARIYQDGKVKYDDDGYLPNKGVREFKLNSSDLANIKKVVHQFLETNPRNYGDSGNNPIFTYFTFYQKNTFNEIKVQSSMPVHVVRVIYQINNILEKHLNYDFNEKLISKL